MFIKNFQNLFLRGSVTSILPNENDDIYVGFGEHRGYFIAEGYLVTKIIPDLKEGSVTLTASPLSVNYYLVWQFEEHLIYRAGNYWIYMPNCPYPGYEPTDDDKYYSYRYSEYFPGDTYAAHGQVLTFEGKGTATGSSKNITVDYGETPVVVNLIEGDDTEVYIAEVATWQ